MKDKNDQSLNTTSRKYPNDILPAVSIWQLWLAKHVSNKNKEPVEEGW